MNEQAVGISASSSMVSIDALVPKVRVILNNGNILCINIFDLASVYSQQVNKNYETRYTISMRPSPQTHREKLATQVTCTISATIGIAKSSQ